MTRNKLEGVYLPRTDIEDWEITIGGTAYRRSAPGPVASATIQLDAIGCLTSGSISLKKPGSVPRPFEQQVLVSVLSRSRGWIPICRACLPPATPDAPQEWTLELQPGEMRNMDGYFDGSLVRYVAGVDGAAADSWKETNRTVVERVLKANPSASIGVDWAGEVVLATPEAGSPVQVSRARFYDWKWQPEVVLPYATESRWDGGKGWAKGEYQGVTRPPCTPRKAIDAGEVIFNEGVYPSGPNVLSQKEVILGWQKDGAAEVIRYTEQDAPLELTRPATRKIRAWQYAHVSVYDLQSWYEGSALAGQSDEQVTTQEQAVQAQQAAYNLALSTLGEGHPLVLQEAERLADARNLLRLLRVTQVVQSYYEPLTAKLSYGFVGQDLGPGVVTGLVAWISSVPWDAAAVGEPLGLDATNPDPQNPLATNVEGVEQNHVVHPFASPNTLMVCEAPLGELSQASSGLPWQPSALTIPETYFRGSMSATLAACMDTQWADAQDAKLAELIADGQEPTATGVAGSGFSQSFGTGATLTGDPPPGMSFDGGLLHGTPTAAGVYTVMVDGQEKTIWVKDTPPSRQWDGRWFFHVAAWWAIIYRGQDS